MPNILFYQIPESDLYFAYKCLAPDRRTLSKEDAEQKFFQNLVNAVKDSYENLDGGVALQSRDIELTPFVSDDPIFIGDLQSKDGEDFEGFQITAENSHKVKNIFERMVTILRDPNLVFRYLKNLDRSIGEEMNRRGVDLSNNAPKYFIAGAGNYMLGPWPDGYQPLKKRRFLNEELLARERSAGINMDGVGLFVGPVSPTDAKLFSKSGNTFSEDEQVGKFLLHGKYSHRLCFEIMRQAAAEGDLSLEIDDGQVLTERQLLQIMVSAKLVSPEITSIVWNTTMDTIEDNVSSIKKSLNLEGGIESYRREHVFRQALLDPINYNFSSRSPAALKSLITCFGREELPNLCRYLTDSHYKQAAQMIGKFRDFAEGKLDDVPDDFLYLSIMKIMSTDTVFLPNYVGGKYPFTSVSEDRMESTVPFDEESYGKNIRRKSPPSTSVDSTEYDSIASYIENKNANKTPTRRGL